MKKIKNVPLVGMAILLVAMSYLWVNAGPIVINPNTTTVKIDDQTVQVTTTFEVPEPTVVNYDRAELQTELDHIPDRKAEIQEQLDAVNEREVELIEILSVFD